jgi:hypothetical protein
MIKLIQKLRTIRLDDIRWAKFKRLGSIYWLRDKIDAEREPKK